jgi:GNAT superfamily N-acetyltransferase
MSQLGYQTSEAEMAARLAQLGAEAGYETLVAETRTGVVGVAGVGLAVYYEKNGLYGRLLVLSVDRTQRGRGIGAALTKAAEEWAAGRGARAMVVTSAHHRLDAHKFYENRGYRSTGVRLVKELTT